VRDRSDPQEALRSAKKALRQRMLSARDAIGGSARAAACAAITTRLLALPAYGRARTVSAYRSFGSEFDTAEFIADVLRTGRRLVLPRIDRAARTLVFHYVSTPDSDLIPGTWGILEPDPASCPVADPREADFMLVPGVAFSPGCDRLGYGGGFYDRAIARVRPDCAKVAAAFSLQIVEFVPTGPNDRKVDAVITELDAYGEVA
jgi:5-formyltetrahydrofolate cyclo-ligase